MLSMIYFVVSPAPYGNYTNFIHPWIKWTPLLSFINGSCQIMRVQMVEVGKVPPYLSLLLAADSLKVNSFCRFISYYSSWICQVVKIEKSKIKSDPWAPPGSPQSPAWREWSRWALAARPPPSCIAGRSPPKITNFVFRICLFIFSSLVLVYVNYSRLIVW